MVKKNIKELEKIEELVKSAGTIRRQIYKKIMEIPQNPEIKELDKSCFTVDSSTLSAHQVMQPSYFNFKIQCAKIVSCLDRLPASKIHDKIKEMTTPTRTGLYLLKGLGYTYRLHPEVVRHLKKFLF